MDKDMAIKMMATMALGCITDKGITALEVAQQARFVIMECVDVERVMKRDMEDVGTGHLISNKGNKNIKMKGRKHLYAIKFDSATFKR